MKTAVAYIRVSTDDQTIGLDAQRAAIAAWCERNAVDLVAEHVDHGVSGAADIDKCPALLAAIDATEVAAVLVVAKRDRIARDVIKSAMIERLVQRNGATIESADGVGNGDGPADELMRNMVAAFAQYERKLIGARTRAALGVLKADGVKLGGEAMGWMRTDATDEHGRRVIAENAAEADTVRVILALRAEGLSMRAIATALTAQGRTTKRGGQWHASTVRNIIRRAA